MLQLPIERPFAQIQAFSFVALARIEVIPSPTIYFPAVGVCAGF